MNPISRWYRWTITNSLRIIPPVSDIDRFIVFFIWETNSHWIQMSWFFQRDCIFFRIVGSSNYWQPLRGKTVKTSSLFWFQYSIQPPKQMEQCLSLTVTGLPSNDGYRQQFILPLSVPPEDASLFSFTGGDDAFWRRRRRWWEQLHNPGWDEAF